MPTNANTFNSRVTSEALEAKFRQVFPSQGGAELPQDLFASGVIQPVIDFSSVAEGSALRSDLQRAWDLSTGHSEIVNTTSTVLNNTGFWLIDLEFSVTHGGSNRNGQLTLTDGITSKTIWRQVAQSSTTGGGVFASSNEFVVFVKSGESITGSTNNAQAVLNVSYRQIADVNGNLVNPLGFTFS